MGIVKKEVLRLLKEEMEVSGGVAVTMIFLRKKMAEYSAKEYLGCTMVVAWLAVEAKEEAEEKEKEVVMKEGKQVCLVTLFVVFDYFGLGAGKLLWTEERREEAEEGAEEVKEVSYLLLIFEMVKASVDVLRENVLK